MKKLRKYAKTTLCIVLSTAMMFTGTGMTVFADESAQAEETQQELYVEETEETSIEEVLEDFSVEEAPAGEETEEPISEENDFDTEAGEDALTDKASEEKDTDVSAEDALTEETVSEVVSTENVDDKETEVSDNDLKLSFSDTDIAHGECKENDSNIIWVINKDGKLTVEGTGEVERSNSARVPWYEKRSEIKTAEINVTGMKDASYMFWGCSNLTSVDVSKFDTSQVTDMGNMFYGCWNLTDLDVSKFDTSQVDHMDMMFFDCRSLADLDVSKFDTSQVTDMDMMFFDCSSLTDLDVSKFDTSQVDSMGMMFSGCNSLTNLDVSKFKTSQVTNMLDMFAMCSSLTDLDVSKFDTSQVTNMWGMFEFCSNLTDLNVSKFDTSQVTDMGNMFYKCSSLTTLNLSNWDLGNLSGESIDDMFYNCQALKRIYTPRNLHSSIMLEGDGWQDTSGNAYTELPTERSDSIFLTKGDAEGIEAVKTKTSYYVGDTVNTDDLTVTYYGSDGTVKVLNASEYKVSTVDTSTAGTKTLTITYGKFTAEIKLTVSKKSDAPAGTKKTVTISGITVKDSVYNKTRVSPTGSARAEADGTDLTGTVKLTYTYTGTQADNTAYTDTQNAPTNAGKYKLTVAVAQDDKNYTGSAEYSFKITPAPLTVTARDMALKIGTPIPKTEDYIYDTNGLLAGDSLTTKPTLACDIADTANAGTYEITISGADAGMNYAVTHQNGTLTVSETGETVEYYTVTFNLNGHGTEITPTSVKAGSLIEKPADPQASGYNFTGWYTDSACTKKWDFAKDTVASDTTLYAGWTKEGEGGNSGNDDNDEDDNYYQYPDNERTDLKTQANAEIATIKAKVYDGNAYEPVIKVTVTVDGKKVTLTEGTDYRVLYENNINAGTTGKVIVKGNGIYKGQIDKTFTISEKPVKKLKILADDIVLGDASAKGVIPSYPYTGKAVTPKVTVGTLTASDYKVQYQNNKDAGTAYAIVTGKKAYKGKVIIPFIIRAETVANPNDFTIKDIKPVTYNGKLQKPSITVTIKKDGKDKKLSKKDYTVVYKNNFHAGEATATVIVTGKGNYEGLSATAKFTINQQEIKKASLKGTKDNLTLTYNKKTLKEGTDYETPTYETNGNKVKVKITGKGDFKGTMEKSVKTS